ncbi:MAG: hypothetical protein GKR90_08650 [Pseudomonadales bacterium]|nr:hypothetical protein [Pseudomonadales bacterium]
MFSTTIIAILICGGLSAGIWFYYYSQRAVTRRDGRRMTVALVQSRAIFQNLDKIPNALISRDLRKGLVLIVGHHLKTLNDLQPRHPFLWDLQNRLQKLNRIPSAFERSTIRTRVDRKAASQALEALCEVVKQARAEELLPNKQADLAAAAALFTSQHIAVETARQAAKDAENVRSYRQALNFIHQAQGLANRLPPLMAEAISESLKGDAERLEAFVSRAA